MNIKEIHSRLEKLLNKCYCPYSKFKVACIVEDEQGNLYEGVNVENASYGVTVCAERNAITTGVTHGSRKFVALYLMGASKDFLAPCGICLQTMIEFMSPNSSVILFDAESRYKVWRLENLIPQYFSKKDLKDE